MGVADDRRAPSSVQWTTAGAVSRPPSALRDGDLDQPAAGDDPHPVGQRLRLVEVVRREQHRGAQVVAQRPDQRPELPPRLRVEAGRRLVEEQQRGVADDAERHVEAAPLPTGQRPSARAGLLGQPDQFEHLVHVARIGVVRRLRLHLLAHGQLAVAAARLQHDAQLPLPVPAGRRRVLAQHPHLAGVAVPVALADLHRRRLAGAVRSEQREDLPAPEVEVQPVDGGEVAVALHQPPDGDGGVRVERIERAPGRSATAAAEDERVTRSTVSPSPLTACAE